MVGNIGPHAASNRPLPQAVLTLVRIAIDAHSVGNQLAGNESYAVNLIEALAEIDRANQYTLYVTRQSAVDRFTDRWPNFQVKRTLPHTPLVRIPLTLSRELRRHPVDLLHVQYTAPPLAPCPIVVTIHDLSFEHLPHTFKKRSWIQLRATVRQTARRAAHIITISDHSKQDIANTYCIEADRITVTPLAAPPNMARVTDDAQLRTVPAKYGIARDYILSLGSLQPRKNLVRLIEAYSILRSERREASYPQLVIAGKRGWLDKETMRAARQSSFAHDIVFTGYVADEDLGAIYSAAMCFVYPSYFEGFGLPVVEAMQCGVPVVAGNVTSLPEVVSGAGVLVNPFDVQALANAIAKIVQNRDLRTELASRGMARARAFTWKRTAELTLEVYKLALGNQASTRR
jgi:glycosyltransferase involved in cell wall biosynthesis